MRPITALTLFIIDCMNKGTLRAPGNRGESSDPATREEIVERPVLGRGAWRAAAAGRCRSWRSAIQRFIPSGRNESKGKVTEKLEAMLGYAAPKGYRRFIFGKHDITMEEQRGENGAEVGMHKGRLWRGGQHNNGMGRGHGGGRSRDLKLAGGWAQVDNLTKPFSGWAGTFAESGQKAEATCDSGRRDICWSIRNNKPKVSELFQDPKTSPSVPGASVTALPGACEALTICSRIFRAAREDATPPASAEVVHAAILVCRKWRTAPQNGGRGPPRLSICSGTCSNGSGGSTNAGSRPLLVRPRLHGVEAHRDRGALAGRIRITIRRLDDPLFRNRQTQHSEAQRDAARLTHAPGDSRYLVRDLSKILAVFSFGGSFKRGEDIAGWDIRSEGKAIIEGIRRLQHLGFSSSSDSINAAIHSATGPSLISWKLFRSAAEQVAANSPQLKILDVGTLKWPEIATIAAGCHHLVSVNLSGAVFREETDIPDVVDNAVLALLYSCPAIAELSLYNTSKSHRPLAMLTLGGLQSRLFDTLDAEIALCELLSARGSSLTRLQIGGVRWRMGSQLALELPDTVGSTLQSPRLEGISTGMIPQNAKTCRVQLATCYNYGKFYLPMRGCWAHSLGSRLREGNDECWIEEDAIGRTSRVGAGTASEAHRRHIFNGLVLM
ncbi:hypothetical protein BDK51DRAFT_34819, partial [Blyttiomyces helicus]